MVKYYNGRFRSEHITAKRIDDGIIVFKSKDSIHLYYDAGYRCAFVRTGSFTATRGRPSEWSGWRAFRMTLWNRRRLNCVECMRIAVRYGISYVRIADGIDLKSPKIKWLATKGG